jgi:ABC-type dipeptide/oligopeptide/nickel transport system permease component
VRGFVARRLAVLVVQVVVVTAGFFLLLRVLPADPAAKFAVSGGQSAVRQAERALGLDASVWTQLWRYFKEIAGGGLGTSWNGGASVGQEVIARFPVTITLVVLAFIVAIAVAVPVGRAAASRPGGRVDRATLAYSLVAGAQPDFFWGLVLVYLLAVKVQLFPVPTGVLSPDVTPPATITHFVLIDSLIGGDLTALGNALWHFALPVLTLAFVLTGPLMKMTRESVAAVVHSDYVLYARASGLGERQIRRLMLRNALAPVLTLTGVMFSFMLGGAVLIEYVFSLNGLGLYALTSTLGLDYPAVQGAVIVLTTFSLLVFLLLDLAHAMVDPRIRLGVDR